MTSPSCKNTIKFTYKIIIGTEWQESSGTYRLNEVNVVKRNVLNAMQHQKTIMVDGVSKKVHRIYKSIIINYI